MAKLLDQLPNVTTNAEVNKKVSLYLKNLFSKPKLYGSDLRKALIQVMHILVNCQTDNENPVFLLISILVKLSENVYSSDTRRCPKQCLQFSNWAFLQYKLYMDLFKPQYISIPC